MRLLEDVHVGSTMTVFFTCIQVGSYTDRKIEQLIPLSDIPGMAEQKEVCSIFYDTLCEDPRSRPSALQLLGYPALINGERTLS